MSVITAVKYDVLEHILKKWLEENFGDQAAYEVRAPPSRFRLPLLSLFGTQPRHDLLGNKADNCSRQATRRVARGIGRLLLQGRLLRYVIEE